jgi:hypothetical protein
LRHHLYTHLSFCLYPVGNRITFNYVKFQMINWAMCIACREKKASRLNKRLKGLTKFIDKYKLLSLTYVHACMHAHRECTPKGWTWTKLAYGVRNWSMFGWEVFCWEEVSFFVLHLLYFCTQNRKKGRRGEIGVGVLAFY